MHFLSRSIVLMGLFLLATTVAMATHNRAGEITFQHLGGFTYEATIITYTKTSSLADRDFLELKWGDGDIDTVPRVEIIFLDNDAQRNKYTAQHTFQGPGVFILSVEDPNRNDGILNMENSVQTPFYIESQLIISPVFGHNNSVILEYPPTDIACFRKTYIHNPGAFDPDGDSLSYALVACKGFNGQDIPSYELPDQVIPGPFNNISIDELSGDVIWDAPQQIGEYNIAILISEYREGMLVGSVLRDMQITVVACSNDPPEIEPIADTCVEAGTVLTLSVSASDPNNDLVTLSALGVPLTLDNSPAFFDSPSPGPDVTGTFSWPTNCDHVQKAPYLVIFRAVDDDTTHLVDLESVFIQVVAPAPENPNADPEGNTIQLFWDQSACENATGYKIYRRVEEFGFEPAACETGVPEYTGYQLLDTVEGLENTSFLDENGLVFGVDYCYMVVACFEDGAQSYASEEFCARLRKDVPVITGVSVGRTDLTNGIDTVRWSKPTELDTLVQFQGPYRYQVYRTDGFSGADQLVHTTSTEPMLSFLDSMWLDSGLNTLETPYSYRVELFSGDDFTGTTSDASSIYLSLIPNDNQLELTWESQVPWQDTLFEIYKFNSGLGAFEFLDTTRQTSYLDTSLSNGAEYCYYIKAIGTYFSPLVMDPLINFSQEACGIPEDLTPSCPPELSVVGDCEAMQNSLTWTNPNNTCADDVLAYRLYYTPIFGGAFEEIMRFFSPTDTTTTHSNLMSIAGCYAVTAIDSVGNESAFSDTVCVDNCPVYELPNVFTPNGDNVNDAFRPLLDYKYIESVEFQVLNRWGQVVFQTQKPEINWSGEHKDSGEPVPEGVYYYTITINEIRLEGIVPVKQAGYFHLFRKDTGNIN